MSQAAAAEAPADIAAVAHASFQAFAADLATLMAERPAERIREGLARGCWIHGAGQYGHTLATLISDRGYPVLGFIDRRAGADLASLAGAPVVHPERFSAGQAAGRTFIGGVLNPAATSFEALAWARGLPFADTVVGAELPEALGEGALTCWLTSRTQVHRNLETLRACAGRLGDPASVDTYVGLLRYRITGDARHHPAADTCNQYAPPDLPGFERPISFVDAGAYTGDTCRDLLSRGVQIARYTAFEPDGENFARLAAFLRNAPVQDATALPCGLSDHAHTVQLAGEGTACRVVGAEAEEPTRSILCLSLDDTMPGLRPDFVKIDIEGSELAALRGMARIIDACRPRLAIALYHQPQDLWDIPAWVAERYDRLYVRQHAANGFETVLYAFANGQGA